MFFLTLAFAGRNHRADGRKKKEETAIGLEGEGEGEGYLKRHIN